MSKLRKRGAVLAILALTAAAVVALVPGSASAAKASGSEVLICQLAAETGAAGTTGRSTQAGDVLDAWVKQTNATGGAGGHVVKKVTIDTKADPASASAALKRCAEQENAVAIVGQADSTTQPTWTPYVTAQKIPVIGGAAYSLDWMTNPNYYPAGPTVPSVVWGETFAAKNAGTKKLASLLCSNATVCNGARPLVLLGAEDNDIEVVYDQLADQEATSYTSQCLAMKNSGADTVLPFVNNQLLARDCKRQGFNPIWIGSETSITKPQLEATPEFDGLVGPMSAFPYFKQFPQTKAFFTAMKKYHPEYMPGGNKEDQLALLSSQTWAAAEVFKKGIENAGTSPDATVTRADLVRGLAQFDGETLGGLTPPLTYGDGTTGNGEQKCFFLYEVKNSSYVPTPANKLETSCQS